MLDTRLPNYDTVRALTNAESQHVWNTLIPKSAVEFKIEGHGVRYLHATKGWNWVGKKRFAIRGVM
jgi:hypothetical protein